VVVSVTVHASRSAAVPLGVDGGPLGGSGLSQPILGTVFIGLGGSGFLCPSPSTWVRFPRLGLVSSAWVGLVFLCPNPSWVRFFALGTVFPPPRGKTGLGGSLVGNVYLLPALLGE
jgi:hypothetical protein